MKRGNATKAKKIEDKLSFLERLQSEPEVKFSFSSNDFTSYISKNSLEENTAMDAEEWKELEKAMAAVFKERIEKQIEKLKEELEEL